VDGYTETGEFMKEKAIALISGGLDSLLAAKVVGEQGIEVLGVVFVMPFASRDIQGFKKNVQEAATDAGIPIRFVDIAKEFLEVLRAPRHGYGANLNPCIDCKILMLDFARKIMQEEGADFVITGEVLGERPMSQRKDALNTIKKRSQLGGRLLRPLSAKLLDETDPEKTGIIDREKLLAFSGRSREPQLKLAEKYGLHKFFAPAGGCLLTDPIFARKLKDLIDKDSFTQDDIDLLKYGRHFRLDNETKIVVGRNEHDNQSLAALKKKKDVMLRLKEGPGPDVLLRGNPTPDNMEKAAAFVISHSRRKDREKEIVEFWNNEEDRKVMQTGPATWREIEELRV
jgi:tRNA U34 2-thiouridine synthase MnmA/TrmU